MGSGVARSAGNFPAVTHDGAAVVVAWAQAPGIRYARLAESGSFVDAGTGIAFTGVVSGAPTSSTVDGGTLVAWC